MSYILCMHRSYLLVMFTNIHNVANTNCILTSQMKTDVHAHVLPSCNVAALQQGSTCFFMRLEQIRQQTSFDINICKDMKSIILPPDSLNLFDQVTKLLVQMGRQPLHTFLARPFLRTRASSWLCFLHFLSILLFQGQQKKCHWNFQSIGFTKIIIF